VASDDEPFAALAFKIAADPVAGDLTFFRVYSGVLTSGDTVLNPGKAVRERIGRLLQMHANDREEITEVRAGDIAAAVGLTSVSTGDSLVDGRNPITLESMEFPEPVIAVALEPRSAADQAVLADALHKLGAEDPSLRVGADSESGRAILSGMGELHLEIVLDRLRREYGVEVSAGRPRVAYRETIRATAEQEGQFVRQSAGAGQQARVLLRLEPLPTGTGYRFENRSAGSPLSEELVAAVDQGVREQMASGVRAGHPIVDIRVILLGVSAGDTDSSPAAFRRAGTLAFRASYEKAGAVPLEPIMRVAVVTPDQFMGDIMGDLSRRRGILRAVADSAAGKVIRAEVPLAEMFGYATSLRSLSQGRATHSMEFARYAAVPARSQAAVSRTH
jgi:elongation factor G